MKEVRSNTADEGDDDEKELSDEEKLARFVKRFSDHGALIYSEIYSLPLLETYDLSDVKAEFSVKYVTSMGETVHDNENEKRHDTEEEAEEEEEENDMSGMYDFAVDDEDDVSKRLLTYGKEMCSFVVEYRPSSLTRPYNLSGVSKIDLANARFVFAVRCDNENCTKHILKKTMDSFRT